MSTSNVEAVPASHFVVVSVEKSNPPEGADGDNWYRYVVERQNSTIVGNVRGTQKQVDVYLEELLDKINLRSGAPNRPSPWSPSISQKTPPKKV